MISVLQKNIRNSCAAVLSLVLLAGCAGITSYGVDPRLTQGDDSDYFTKSGVQACAAGAAAGALACLVSNSGNKAACMAIAAVAGCGIGAGVDALIDQRRKQAASKEQYLNSLIADVQNDNQKMAERISTFDQVISENSKTLAALQTAVANKTVDQKKATADLAQLTRNKEYMEKQLAGMNKRIAEWNEAASAVQQEGVNPQQLRQQISELEARKASLTQSLAKAYEPLLSLQSALS